MQYPVASHTGGHDPVPTTQNPITADTGGCHSVPTAQYPLVTFTGGSDVTCSAPNITIHPYPTWNTGSSGNYLTPLYMDYSSNIQLANALLAGKQMVSFTESESVFALVKVSQSGVLLDFCSFHIGLQHYGWNETRLSVGFGFPSCKNDQHHWDFNRGTWNHIGFTYDRECSVLRLVTYRPVL